ncbi:MAG: glycoside hydrolase [Flavobacteriales bacterium]|nr:glycoside hydrolase [Flavobacteriales bacterium]
MKNLYLLVICSFFSFNLMAQTYSVTDYGAVGDGSTVNTVAIQSAIDSCHANGGGEVVFADGDFVTGTIFLKSNVLLNIQNGAKILGSTSISDYPDTMPQLPTYVNNYTKKTLIYAEGEENFGIVGEGRLDGQGSSFLGQNERPFGFRFVSCSNVLVEDVSLRNSGFWMMHNFNCDSVIIRNVDIYNQGNSNNDGLSIDGCRNVLIENCTVDCNDDPLVLKTTGPADCEDIEIRNCTVATWARAIKIGTETHAGFRNVHIHDITVEWSSLAFPPFVGVGSCGINLAIVDGGFMENVIVENVTMEGIETAMLIRLGDRGHVWEDGLPTPSVGSLRNVVVRNVQATVESNVTSSITGIPDHYASNISLENISVNFPGGASDPGSAFVVPENEDAKPDNDIFGQTLPSFGLYVRHVDSLQLSNVCFTWQDSDARPGIILDDVTNTPNYTVVSGTDGGCVEVASGIREMLTEVSFWVGYDRNLHIIDSQNRLLQFELQSLDGKTVLSRNLRAGVHSLPELAAGVYVAKISCGNGQKALKFVL